MEIELKLSLRPSDVARLRRHALLAGVKPQRRNLHSTYLDTPDWSLMRRGIALRVRRAGRQWVQTLKAESASVGALTQRPEWECTLPRGHHDLEKLPPQALALLAEVDVSRIAPAFSTEFTRTAWMLEKDGTRMEVALDVGQVRSGEASMPLCELEIELKSGPPDALFDLALGLLASVPMGVEPRSKAARGYVLAGAVQPRAVKASVPELPATLTAGEAWVRLASSALAQMVANVPGFLSTPEELEYLHQLRVGARRLRAMLDLLPSLRQPAPEWLPDLKALMANLNAARDWDVLLVEVLPQVVPVLADPPLSAALHARLRQQAQQAHEVARQAVAGPEFARLVLAAGRDLLHPPALDVGVTPWATACLDQRWQRLRKRGRRFARLDAAQRHRVRIACKRLRYTAEALAPLYRTADRFIARLAKLQDQLGASQDAAMATQRIAALGSRVARINFDAGRIVGVLALRMAQRDAAGTRTWQAWRSTRPFWRGAGRQRQAGR